MILQLPHSEEKEGSIIPFGRRELEREREKKSKRWVGQGNRFPMLPAAHFLLLVEEIRHGAAVRGGKR